MAPTGAQSGPSQIYHFRCQMYAGGKILELVESTKRDLTIVASTGGEKLEGVGGKKRSYGRNGDGGWPHGCSSCDGTNLKPPGASLLALILCCRRILLQISSRSPRSSIPFRLNLHLFRMHFTSPILSVFGLHFKLFAGGGCFFANNRWLLHSRACSASLRRTMASLLWIPGVVSLNKSSLLLSVVYLGEYRSFFAVAFSRCQLRAFLADFRFLNFLVVVCCGELFGSCVSVLSCDA